MEEGMDPRRGPPLMGGSRWVPGDMYHLGSSSGDGGSNNMSTRLRFEDSGESSTGLRMGHQETGKGPESSRPPVRKPSQPSPKLVAARSSGSRRVHRPNQGSVPGQWNALHGFMDGLDEGGSEAMGMEGDPHLGMGLSTNLGLSEEIIVHPPHVQSLSNFNLPGRSGRPGPSTLNFLSGRSSMQAGNVTNYFGGRIAVGEDVNARIGLSGSPPPSQPMSLTMQAALHSASPSTPCPSRPPPHPPSLRGRLQGSSFHSLLLPPSPLGPAPSRLPPSLPFNPVSSALSIKSLESPATVFRGPLLHGSSPGGLRERGFMSAAKSVLGMPFQGLQMPTGDGGSQLRLLSGGLAEDSQGTINEDKDTKLLDRSRQLVCKYYKNPANCKFGTKCKFTHSQDKDVSSSVYQSVLDTPSQNQIVPKRIGAVWCKFCRKLCASEGQLEHHMTTKLHKKKLEDIGIEEPLPLASTISYVEPDSNPIMQMRSGKNSDEEAFIATLRKKGIDIPYNVKRVLQVKKIEDIEEKDLQDITYSAILMEGEDIIAILDYNFFKVKAEENNLQLVKNFVSLNRDGGVVKRKKGGGEIKMFGCKSFMHMWGMYKQSINGKEPEEREHKKMKKASKEKLSPEQLDVLAGELTLSLCTEMEKKMASWMVALENLVPIICGKLWGRLGTSPFTTMGLTKNYWMPKHIDKKDIGKSFIIWFEIGPYEKKIKRTAFLLNDYAIRIWPTQGTLICFNTGTV